MLGWKHQSGASKRKAKLEREERERKLPTMTKYVLSAASAEQYDHSTQSSCQTPISTNCASVEVLPTPSPRFPGKKQGLTHLGCLDPVKTVPTSVVHICEQPTLTEPCPVPESAMSMLLSRAPATELQVSGLPCPISTTADQQVPNLPDEASSTDERQKTTLQEPTHLFPVSLASYNHVPTHKVCLERTNETASRCGNREVQTPPQQEIIEALLRDSNTVDTQEEASSSSSQPPESDSVEFSDKSTAGTLPEESGMAECSSNVQYSLPVSVSCDTGKSAVQQCSIFVQVALRASCCSTGIQTAPKAVSSSTQTVGTFCDKRNSSVQTEGEDLDENFVWHSMAKKKQFFRC
ncbi:uncharacterized protein LOC144124719 [Amblyomma americanum]